MNRIIYNMICLCILLLWNGSPIFTQEVLLNHQESIEDIRINQNGQLQILSDTSIFTFLNTQEVSQISPTKEPAESFVPVGTDTFVLMAQNQIMLVHKDNVLFRDTLPEIITSSLLYQDSVIIATGEGLYILDSDHHISTVRGMEDKYINAVDVADHELFIALDYGVGKIDLKSKEITVHQLDKIVNHVTTLRNGHIILITAEDEVILMNKEFDIIKQHHISIGKIRGISSSFDEAFITSSTGCYQLTNTLGVRSLVKGSFDQILACSNTLLLVQGRDLIKWNITSEEVLTEHAVFSLFAGGNSLWTGSKGEIHEYQNDQIVRTIEIPASSEELFVSAIVTDESNIYAGTMGAGVFIYNKMGELNKRIYQPEKKNQNNIIQIKKLKSDIWIAYLNGLYTIDSSSFRIKNDYGDILEKNYLYCFEPINDEEFYVGTSSRGVLSYHHGIQSSFLDGKSVYSLSSLKRKGILAGTEKEGSWILLDEQPYKIDDIPGIISTFTIPGIIILVTRNQVMAMPDATFGSHPDRQNGLDNDSRIFSFPLNSLYNGHLNSITQNEQNIFIGFENGYLKIRKERLYSLFDNKIHPIRPLLFNQQIEQNKSYFRYNENSLSFTYHNQFYNQITPTIFKFRLRGLDDNWQVTQQKSINYYNLPAGEYVFQVADGFNADFAPEDPQSYAFTIDKPFWRKTVFIMGIIMAVIVLALFLIRKRERLVISREKRAQEKIKFELQQLKNQIDPHFLFNSLNSLVGQMEENPKAASGSLQDLSDLYRNILEYEKMELISIREDIRLGKKYFDIHKIRFEDLIELQLDMACKPEGRILPMTIQFLIENAIKHNIINQENPLFIFIRVDTDFLQVSNSYQPKKSNPREGGGLGLKNLKARYRYYTEKPVRIIQSDELFSVKIPILYV